MNNYIPAYNIDLLPVLAALILLATVILWIAIKNYKNLMAMIVIIPLTIFSGWTVYTTIDKLLGYPVVEKITNESIYLFHTDDLTGDWIFVWIFKPTDTRPKSIMIPNTETNQEEMDEAKQRSENGIPQVVRTKDNRNGQTNGGELERYDFQMQDIHNLKEAEPQTETIDNTDHIRNPTKKKKVVNRPEDFSRITPFTGYEYKHQNNDDMFTFEKSKIRVIIPSGK